MKNIFEIIANYFSRLIKKNERFKTLDEEYNTIKEQSIESEKKLNDTIKKIQKIKDLLNEISLLQMELAYSLNEMAVGDLNITQKLNSFTEVIREIIDEHEYFDTCLTERLLIPLNSFANQYKSLHSREKELETRRNKMEKSKKQMIQSRKKQRNLGKLNELERDYSNKKNHYMKLRNELKNDRSLLLKVMPSVSFDIANQFVREGWGCLMLKRNLWERIQEVFEESDYKSIDSFTSIITSQTSSETNTKMKTSMKDQSNIFNARVLYDYEPKNEKELKLKEGDWIHVFSTDGYWWEGEQNGVVGLFPSNYVIKDVTL